MLAAMGSKSRPKAVAYDPRFLDPEFSQAYNEIFYTIKEHCKRIDVEPAAQRKGALKSISLSGVLMRDLIGRCAAIKLMLSFSDKPKRWARDLVDRTLSGEMDPYRFSDGNKSSSAEVHRYLQELKTHHARLVRGYTKCDDLEKKLRKAYEELIAFYLPPAPDPVVELYEHLKANVGENYFPSEIKQLAGQIAGLVFPEQVGIGSFSKKEEVSISKVSMSKIAADIINRKKRYDAKRKDSPTGVRHGALIIDE